MRDKHLGIMAQFWPLTAYLYYIKEVKILDENQAAKPVELGAFLVQPWCNQGGKNGNYGRNGQFAVNSIERMDPSTTLRASYSPRERMDTPNTQFEVRRLSWAQRWALSIELRVRVETHYTAEVILVKFQWTFLQFF